MFPYLILGFAILAGVLLAGRWFTTADPAPPEPVFEQPHGAESSTDQSALLPDAWFPKL